MANILSWTSSKIEVEPPKLDHGDYRVKVFVEGSGCAINVE